MDTPQLSPAQPLTLEQRLMQLLYGEPGLEHMAKRRIQQSEEAAAGREAFEEAGGGMDAPIPGGNPEVPTGADALLGALMSMGGVPPAIARSGMMETQRPAMARPKSERFKSEEDRPGRATREEWITANQKQLSINQLRDRRRASKYQDELHARRQALKAKLRGEPEPDRPTVGSELAGRQSELIRGMSDEMLAKQIAQYEADLLPRTKADGQGSYIPPGGKKSTKAMLSELRAEQARRSMDKPEPK